MQFRERNDFEATDKVRRLISNQSALCETDRDGKIRDDAIAICLSGITIDSRREINGKDVSVFVATQSIDLATCLTNGLPQRRLRPETKQTIEDNGAECSRSGAFQSADGGGLETAAP